MRKKRDYIRQWKKCNKCIKEICRDVHYTTTDDFMFYDKSDTLLIDGRGYHIDTVCIADSDATDKVTVRTDERTVVFKSDKLIDAFNYILNDYKDLQLEDAIKITNLRNKQLKFMEDKV